MRKNRKSNNKQSKTTTQVGPEELDWSYFNGLEVKVFNNFEKAARLFRNLVQADGILALYKEKSSYEKPSMKRRRKHAETMQRLHEEEIKRQKILSGEYDKEKEKKEAKKAKRIAERDAKKSQGGEDVG
jgi:ribosomal protein S21